MCKSGTSVIEANSSTLNIIIMEIKTPSQSKKVCLKADYKKMQHAISFIKLIRLNARDCLQKMSVMFILELVAQK